jgi:hypothetical protein
MAEVCLLATWCVLGTQPILFRLPLTFVLLTAATSSFCVSLRLRRGDIVMEETILFGAAATIAFFAMLVLMCGMRCISGKRIRPSDVPTSVACDESAQFSLRYLMGGTAVTAILIVLIKNSLTDNSAGWIPGLIPVLGRGFTVVATYILFSASISIPCVWLLLAETRSQLWIPGLAAVAVVGPFLMYGARWAIVGSPAHVEEALVSIYVFAGGMIGVMLLVLWLVRMLGYRLVADTGS